MMKRIIAALCLATLCLGISPSFGQPVTRSGTPPALNGLIPPVIEQGKPDELFFNKTDHSVWLRSVTGWSQLGILNPPTAPDIVAGPPPPNVQNGFFMGVNYSGLETGPAPGRIYYEFQFPDNASIAYLASRGLKVIRLPILWERIQPTLNGPLDQTYLGYIKTAASYAASLGVGFIVDVHNYGSYAVIDYSQGLANARYIGSYNIGSTQVPITAFADLWSKVAAGLYNQPGIVGFDLMNEPIALGPVLAPAMQAAVTAIRAYDTSHTIYVEGDQYSSAGQWTVFAQKDFAISDPAYRLVYEAHNYLDCDSSGSHSNWAIQSTDPSQPEPGGTTCNSGQAINVNTGVQRATVFADWCAAHNYACMIGEVGAGSDDPNWLIELDNELAFLKSRNIPVTYWSAGTDFTDYYYNVQMQPPGRQPNNSQDTKQMAVLEKYTGFAALPYFISGPRTGTPGTPSTFNIMVRGYIANPTTITLSDGGAGGTFNPPAVVLAPGFNGSGTFTYSAPGTALFHVASTASNPAWVPPAAVGFSTAPDLLASIASGSGSTPVNVFSNSAINTTFSGQVLTLRRASDGATQSFPYVNGKVDTAAIATWAGGATLTMVGMVDTAPNANGNSLVPVVAGGSDEAIWNATALNGHPAFILSNSRLITASPITLMPAATLVTTVYLTSGTGCERLFSWEHTTRWLVPGNNGGWWQDDFDTPINLGQVEGLHPHVLTMRWQGQGTGTGKRDLFVDGALVGSANTTMAHLPGPDFSGATNPPDIGSPGDFSLRMGWFVNYAPCFTNGVVGDILVFSGALSDSEVASTYAYEKAQFSLP